MERQEALSKSILDSSYVAKKRRLMAKKTGLTPRKKKPRLAPPVQIAKRLQIEDNDEHVSITLLE